jgi:hypothetical protein
MHLESSYLEAFAVRAVLGAIDLADATTITVIPTHHSALIIKALAFVCMLNGMDGDIVATIKAGADLMIALLIGMGMHTRGSATRNSRNRK